jgi:hypothetical protein
MAQDVLVLRVLFVTHNVYSVNHDLLSDQQHELGQIMHKANYDYSRCQILLILPGKSEMPFLGVSR